MSGRTSTPAGDLARRGFRDATRAAGHCQIILGRPAAAAQAPHWLDIASAAADPDLALQGLAGLTETDPGLADRLFGDRDWLGRTIAVLGGSLALNQHVRAHPGHLRVLAGDLRRFPAAELRASLMSRISPGRFTDPATCVLADSAAEDLRLANKRELLRIAARDLCHPDPASIVEEIAGELADLADAVFEVALAIARGQVPEHDQARLAVIALGKCGAQELNYLSDVDVLYVAEPASDRVGVEQAVQAATKVVAAATRICSAHTPAGTIWQVDAALRPDGKSGPLVRSLGSHRAYYQKWARNWEFQAMLKARPMAGDLALGEQFCDLVAPLVWQAGGRDSFMAETQAMRQRVIGLIPARERDREIKLGPGGLRDVEFSVQLLQLVHGRADERLRLRATLPALTALIDYGYIGRADGARLAEAYRFMRLLEHREQLFRLRRTHLMPENPAELDRLARQVGAEDGRALGEQWRRMTREVQRLQQRVFYSPLLAAVSRLSNDELRLPAGAATDRLRALGFTDPKAALRHIGALTTGLNRTAIIQRQLMPAMLHWFCEGPNPDLGLLGFRRLSDQMGATSWYMRALRDSGAMAQRLAWLLSASRYCSDLLRRDASMVRLLADPAETAAPQNRVDLLATMLQIAKRHADADEAIKQIRALRGRELFRLAAANLLGGVDLAALGTGLADLTGATIDAALRVIGEEYGSERAPIGVVAMGRWGGGELGFSSDADAMFVLPGDAAPEQIQGAQKVIARIRAVLGAAGPEPALSIDPGLRPDGKNGPIARSLGGYLSYYARWSQTWEAQALLRASHGAGDAELTAELLAGVASRRYPPDGITPAQVTEIRRLKARMERERAGRGSAGINLKLGAGGLSDVEWTVQLLQLQHAGRHPGLRTTATLPALTAAQELGLVAQPDAAALSAAWQLASRLRNMAVLVRGRSSDLLPQDPREVASVALLLGYGPGQASELLQTWARTARHAAQVVDRLFWGRAR